MTRRDLVLSWMASGLRAVDGETLTHAALAARAGPVTVIAIGKAAPAMCRGAASALGQVDGLCVTDHPAPVPEGVELLVGDHPVPGEASLRAGRRAQEVAKTAGLALISGGGSALCEVPAAGLRLETVASVYERLLQGGADIVETNLVRRHLSQTKGGGLGAIPTLVISDVAGADAGTVSSGPTIPATHDPEAALDVMRRYDVEITAALDRAVRGQAVAASNGAPLVEVIGDGQTAARAVARAAEGHAKSSQVYPDWLTGPLETCLEHFLTRTSSGVTVAAGEPQVAHRGSGRGGRNTHAALVAATKIAGTDTLFAALATDGVDGGSGAAGAIVDRTTITRGGDPWYSVSGFDSATYLGGTRDLIELGPTGTNVADLWLIWKP
jgi:glycerate-2-kinase